MTTGHCPAAAAAAAVIARRAFLFAPVVGRGETAASTAVACADREKVMLLIRRPMGECVFFSILLPYKTGEYGKSRGTWK